ncbi:ORF238 [White spot syndrome virus]|uniref:ORF238 n=1 Tax=White spot syndrome virus TaxID=342409 RepID=A0A2D3I5W7_9VIRU|nr:ORF238 [White spot syndrome virus]
MSKGCKGSTPNKGIGTNFASSVRGKNGLSSLYDFEKVVARTQFLAFFNASADIRRRILFNFCSVVWLLNPPHNEYMALSIFSLA